MHVCSSRKESIYAGARLVREYIDLEHDDFGTVRSHHNENNQFFVLRSSSCLLYMFCDVDHPSLVIPNYRSPSDCCNGAAYLVTCLSLVM